MIIVGLLSLLAILCLILLAEKMRRDHHLKPEVTRKFVHISVGSFIAFWPFFMPHWMVYLACLAFVTVIVMSRYFGYFRSIHSVERKTWGDLLFPIGIAITMAIAQTDWIFAVAILHMSLADGTAALVGEKWGGKHAYKVFGFKKTILGNLSFGLVSVLIMACLVWGVDAGFSNLGFSALIWIPLIATFLEAVSVKGSDNLVVPIVLSIMLNLLHSVG